ncbi:MAG: DUF2723 domain-containing protein [Chloroflexota bacterium]
MKPNQPQTFFRLLPPILLALSLSGIYLFTLAPGLTWANAGSDGGDLITAAWTGGIAHPTGYPLYLILARIFQWLPIGSLAYRTNLMSALAMTAAAVLVYGLVTQTLSQSGIDLNWPAGLAAGFAFGLAPLVWSQAVITEVYALQAFLTALILNLYLPSRPLQDINPKSLDRWRGLAIGLAAGNHITTLFVVPLALFLGSLQRESEEKAAPRTESPRYGKLPIDVVSLLRQLIWFGIGLSVYLILPLRAMAHPPVNWGNPITFERFWWLVSGQLYQSYYLQFTLAGGWGHVQTWAVLLLQQFGLVGLVLGSLGLALFFTPSRLYAFTIWISIVYSALMFVYRSDDALVYLIPVYLVFAIWIGLGAGNVMGRFALRSNSIRLGLGLLLIGYFVIRSLGFVEQVDAAPDLRAEQFGRQVLDAAPDNALIFAKGDQAVFSLWYFRFALNERPDLVVIAEDLLHFDWYQETLQKVYPALGVPGPFPWPETIALANPQRAVCYIQYTDQAEINCREPVGPP